MKKHEIGYDRKNIEAGILHFGVGGFHRAHQAYYTNLLLEHPDQSSWGICGAMIRQEDEALFKKLKKQNMKYGLTVFGRTGFDEYYEIGSIVELLWGKDSPLEIIDKIADSGIKIISLTITEGGYKIEKDSGEFDLENADVLHDLKHPSDPKTVFGYVAAGLKKRRAMGNGPITIMTCDNLPHNGDVCKKAFLSFIKAADQVLLEWADTNISFPNTMVDRITPATHPEDVTRLNDLSKSEDLAPVFCEDFVQWVIEDNFLAGRPNWERVGVEFTQDVSKFEQMKLGFVNSTHQMLSFLAVLAGYRKVDKAVSNNILYELLDQYMRFDVEPRLVPPEKTDFALYRQTVLERLGNKAVSDQVLRLCSDAANKIPVYMLNIINGVIKEKQNCNRIALFVAAYRKYLRSKQDDTGQSYEIFDPALTEGDLKLVHSDNATDFFDLKCFTGFLMKDSKDFIEAYEKMIRSLAENGVLKTIDSVI